RLLFKKHERITGRSHVDTDLIARFDLRRRDQTRQWENQKPFNSAFQMTRSVFQIRAFLKKKIFCSFSAVESEGTFLLCCHDSALNMRGFKIENVTQLIAIKTTKDHDLIDSIHEFRREFALSRIDGHTMNFAVHFLGKIRGRLRRKTDTTG